jgi:hypothetical protein
MSGRSQGGKAKAKKVSKSVSAGLQIPVRRILSILKRGNYSKRIAVPPIVVRIGRTWFEFGLFGEKGSEKGPNCLHKVRFGYIKW